MNNIRLSDPFQSAIWADREPDSLADTRNRLRAIAKESGTQFGKLLLGECAMRGISTEHVRELESHLGMDYPLRNMLRRITQRLRQQIPRFPLARIAIAIKRAANPINPDLYTAERLLHSHQVLQALRQGLKLSLDSLDAEERIGLLLLSSAYCGGLMDLAQLNAVLEVPLKSIEWLAGIPEIRLPLSIRGTDEAEYRQWFPDPATLALLIRCADDVRARKEQVQRKGGKLRCIHSFLRAAGMPEQDLPRNLTELLDLLRMQMQLRLSQMLVNFACRQAFVSQSIRPSSWGDMFGHADLEDPAGAYGDDNRSDTAKDPDAPDWVLELCQRIRAGESSEIPLQTEAQAELADLVQGWTAFMLNGASAYGHDIGRSTIARYARLLGPALVSQLDGASIFELETDALEIVYESALEAQSTDGKRRTLAKAIHEFHFFLQRRYSYPPISPYSLLGIGKGVTRVDARILSEDQYQSVLQALGTCGLELRTPQLVTAARLFLILGFRLGLRRNEALKLRLCDLHLPELATEASARIQKRHPNMRKLSSEELAGLELPVDLLIRPHAQRGLKTQNAVRRLPLRVLLEPDELQLLIDWYRQRLEEEAANPASEYLFCIPQLKTLWISESSLLPALHGCMRAVTGSESVHYHHLRHSCATWLSLKLMASLGEFSPEMIFRDLPQTMRWLRDDLRLRSALFSAKGGPTRRIVHIVSAILGHGSPKTTLLHYIHSLPQIMAMAWQWSPRNWLFSAYNIASIAGVSQPTMKAEPSDGVSVDCQQLLDIIGRIKPLKERRRARQKAPRNQAQQVEHNWAIERVRTIESMLAYASYAEQTGRQVNLDWLEFSAEDRALMLERARYIRDMQQPSRTNTPRPKHRLQSTLHANDPSYTSLLPTPPKHGGRDAVTEYAQRLYELLEGPDSERAQRVIDDFVERCWTTETTLRFYRDRDEEHARDYLWLLTAIGIPARAIELIIYDTNKPKTTKSYWRQRLGNIRRPFSQHMPENPDVENLHLGIRAQLKLPDEQGQNLHSGSALRYLMLMASIDWHFRG
ncbi:TPA: tyrosine-type recombinase/integrase [Pseudomonas aeruginosa]|jgi:integrase|uniref:Phage integrase family protein n=11 Tax=Pseudomonadaceae TaxID=135621 RepID=A0A9P1VW55_PSEAI|nr:MULTISPECIES: tyrosine-type recombinase/integrase [Pseudomonadaceae]CDI94836.1 Site-specific recombinase XerC [Pseudomonas aeruginosa PA38182]CEG52998.1 conserved hypothetical protein [Stutzerimonas xanthomarina]EIU5123497.1 phage integrase family protein [Pseudomonas aeruginosa]EIU5197070.1 phage integrase family protein [Pseudomonas aeruginosa]EIU5214066.1 phage integrase family protein [Pseudomonas aeruginosa]